MPINIYINKYLVVELCLQGTHLGSENSTNKHLMLNTCNYANSKVTLSGIAPVTSLKLINSLKISGLAEGLACRNKAENPGFYKSFRGLFVLG